MLRKTVIYHKIRQRMINDVMGFCKNLLVIVILLNMRSMMLFCELSCFESKQHDQI